MRGRSLGWLATAVAVVLGLAPGASGQRIPRPPNAEPSSLTRLGTFVVPGTGEALGPTATSGGLVFSGAPGASFTTLAQGAVFVFDAAGAGGSAEHERARLVASDAAAGDELGGGLAASGSTVVASNSGRPAGRGDLWVFREPSRGWSGTVTQAATLQAPAGVTLCAPEISGSTIVAQGVTEVGGVVRIEKLYLFTEPAGGWSGVIGPSAVLAASNGDQLGGAVAIEGSTIVAGAPTNDAAFVFTEPTSGWAGVVHESAVLTGTDVSAQEHSHPGLPFGAGFGYSVALAGDAVLVGELPLPPLSGNAYVFTKPAGGWHSETQAAELTNPTAHLLGFVPFDARDGVISFNGSLAAIAGAPRTAGGADGPSQIYLYTEPASGWAGVLTPSAALTPRDGSAVNTPAIVGSTVYAGSLAATTSSVVSVGPVDVFTEPSGGWSGTVHESATLTPASGTSSVQVGGATTFTQLSLFGVPSGGWSGATAADPLIPSGDPAQVIFDSVTASGGTAVAAGGSDAYVFSEPPAGWGSGPAPVATLRDPGGGRLEQPELSGDTVVARVNRNPPGGGSPPAMELFVRPAGGWSGTIMPAASVTLPASDELQDFAYAGRTIAISVWTGQHNETDVVSEPAAGWSGTLAPVARLDVPFEGPGRPDVDGNMVIVGATGSASTVVGRATAYAFREPALGWSGTVRPTATLSAPFSITNGVWVWTEPRAGWHGTVHTTVRLLADNPVVAAAISGRNVALATFYGDGKYGCEPCVSDLHIFREPANGWRGALSAPTAASATVSDVPALALDGDVAFFGAQPIPGGTATALDVFQVPGTVPETVITPSPPVVSGRSVGGLTSGSPKLGFTLSAGVNAAPIAAVELTLPGGLTLAPQPKALRRGTSLCQLNFITCKRVRARLLRITVNPYSTQVGITLARPALAEAAALRRTITALRRFNRTHRHHRALRLQFHLKITDAFGHITHATSTATIT